MQIGSVLRRVAVLVTLGGFAIVVALTGTRLDRAATAATGSDDPVYLPRAEYLRPMSLGWHNALADVLWFRTISYFGEHYRNDRTYAWLGDMCDLVTDLDPQAEHVYRFCGTVLPWEADQVDAGIHMLDKGTRQIPDSWTLQYYLGFLEYFFKDNRPKALEHLRRAAQLPGAHPEVAHLAALLATEQYGPETTLGLLAELERNADSAELRTMIRDSVQDAQAMQNLQQLNTAATTYAARTGHSPERAEDLVEAGLLGALPIDPFGGLYVVDPSTGTIQSSTGRAPAHLHDSPMRQRVRRGESVRDS